MDDILRVVFFLVILGVGALIKRMGEKREEETAQKNAPRSLRKEELPEATRRMIYGEQGVPTARTARPAGYAEDDRDGVNDEGDAGRAASGKRDVLVMLEEMARQAQGANPVTRTPTPVARPAPPQAAPQRAVPQQPVRRASMEPERVSPQARPVPAGRPAPRPVPAPPVSAKPAAPPAKPAAKAPEPKREQRKAAGSLGALLRNMDDVRRGVIMSEILGTPKGMV
jgi:hypothetical protein